jgi:uncharacterized protein
MDAKRPRKGGYVSPKVRGRSRGGQRHAFARAAIDVGELVAVWSGAIVTRDYIAALGEEAGKTCVQIDDELFLASSGTDPSDWINHSCDPNLGMRGQIVLVARRPIAAGEELCYDYAMTDGCAYDEFACHCGSALCRGRVTGDDWRLPLLQRRYRGYFSPYLAQRIARQRVAA